jgi:transmembrane sensor
MSEQQSAATDAAPLLEQAASWHDRLRDGTDAATRASFERWFAADPRHAMAFEEIGTTVQTARDLADEPALRLLREQTASRVAALSARRRVWRGALAASLAAVLVGSAGFVALSASGGRPGWGQHQDAGRTYVTRAGEIRSIDLPDGSRVTLNGASRLRVAFSDRARGLTLERGQGFFEVAKEARPFAVEAGGRTVVAHGTEFDVRVADGSLRVALIKGSVSVEARRKAQVVWLRPNDVLMGRGDKVDVRHLDDARMLSAWRDGRIVFRNEALGSAIADMNRYGDTQIILADDRIARLRISGAFDVGDAAAFAEALEASFPVRVESRDDRRIVLVGR